MATEHFVLICMAFLLPIVYYTIGISAEYKQILVGLRGCL